jgi:hypothetical protein
MQASLIDTSSPRFSGLTLGKVYMVHPEANMVDIMQLDGTVLKHVRVLSFSSSKEGLYNLPVPNYEKFMLDKKPPLSHAKENEKDVFAVVGFLGGSNLRPVCLGFLFPEESELLCTVAQKGNEDGTMLLWKHPSNVYARVAKGQTKGVTPDIEISHPSGLLIKIGSDTVRTEILNRDKDTRVFKYKNPETDELDPAPYVHVDHPSGTWITIDPDGNVEIYIVGNKTETIEGDCTELVMGNKTVTIEGNKTVTVEGDKSITTEGTENHVVEGAWTRESATLISDMAPEISHE